MFMTKEPIYINIIITTTKNYVNIKSNNYIPVFEQNSKKLPQRFIVKQHAAVEGVQFRKNPWFVRHLWKLILSLMLGWIRAVFDHGAFPEQQWKAPDAGKGNKGIDDPADHSALSAEDPSHYIKLKQTDTAPVQSADYD